MKQLFTFLFVFGAMLNSSFAQKAEAVFFTEIGEKFTAYLNGVQINDAPANNVKAQDLSEEFYQFRAQFEDSSLPAVSSNLMVKAGYTTTYMIKMNKKGKYVLRMFGESPIGSAPAVAANPEPVMPPPPPPAPSKEEIRTTAQPASGMTQTETITTTTRTNGGDGDGESVNMKVNIDGFSMGVSMDASGSGVQTSQTTTTTTTTTRTSGMDIDSHMDTTVEPELVDTETVVRTYNGYTGPSGCDWPSSDSEFESFKKSMEAKSFSDSKMTLAKQYTKAHCMLAEQVKQVMAGFDFEDDRLDYAKFAYDHTYDQANYYKVNDAFEFEMTIEELDEYIQSK